MSRARPRVLLLPLEFMTWPRARAWTYCAQLALAEGLQASGAEVVALPAFNEVPAGHPGAWLSRLDHWVRGQRFDQIWLWPCLTRYDRVVLEWTVAHAPIRVGLIAESLSFTAEELRARPDFAAYRLGVRAQVPYLTHACAGDERDVGWLRGLGVAACWWPPAVPARVIVQRPGVPPARVAEFVGTAYGARAQWLASPELSALLRHAPVAEAHSRLVGEFERLNAHAVTQIWSGDLSLREARHLQADWISVRRRIFDRYMRALRRSSAVVGLPGYVKAYAGRVVEAMAAGRPVVAAALPDRPLATGLFRDGDEIALYPADDPHCLADRLRGLRDHPDRARDMAARALALVRANHTIEHRVRQIQDWIETARRPTFRDGSAPPRPASSHTGHRTVTARHPAPSWLDEARFAGPYATVRVDDLVVTVENWDVVARRVGSIAQRRPLVCWGAGLRGRVILAMVRAAGYTCDAFVDADAAKAGTMCDGLPIHAPGWLEAAPPGVKPFVLVTSLHAARIAHSLRCVGYRRGVDWLVPRG